MPVTIKVREGEDFETALRRFKRAASIEHSRPWYKRRRGHFEKPSVLRRKREKMARLRVFMPDLGLEIGIAEQLRRTGPTNAAGA